MKQISRIEDRSGHKGTFAGKGGIIVCFSLSRQSHWDSETTARILLCIALCPMSVPLIHDHI
jgi:hypothetical protein